MNENILVVAMISCHFWLYMGPVVATFNLTLFLATDRSANFKWPTELGDELFGLRAMKGVIRLNREHILS